MIRRVALFLASAVVTATVLLLAVQGGTVAVHLAAQVIHPAPSCAMLVDDDACLDTSTFTDLRDGHA
jgi:hypothetical protein